MSDTRPLADIMRPNTIEDVVGQRALLDDVYGNNELCFYTRHSKNKPG